MNFPYTSPFESYYLLLTILSVVTSFVLLGALSELLFKKGGWWETRFSNIFPSDMPIWAYLKSRLSFPWLSVGAVAYLFVFGLVWALESGRVVHRNVALILDAPEQLSVTSNHLYVDKTTLLSVMTEHDVGGGWFLLYRDGGQHCFAVTVTNKSTQDSLTYDFYRASKDSDAYVFKIREYHIQDEPSPFYSETIDRIGCDR